MWNYCHLVSGGNGRKIGSQMKHSRVNVCVCISCTCRVSNHHLRSGMEGFSTSHSITSWTCVSVSIGLCGEEMCLPSSTCKLTLSELGSFKFVFQVTLLPHPSYVWSGSCFLLRDRSLYKVDLKLQTISGILFLEEVSGYHFCDGKQRILK